MTSQLIESRTVTELPGGPGRGPGGQLVALPRGGRCPVPGCRVQIDPSRLMCRSHWSLEPKPMRDQVWATWRSGHAALSPEHQEAVRLAVTACQAAA
jgi:hypothetical protein